MESNEKIKQPFFKINFLKKIWYSISKFEKYPEMAALGIKSALLYFTELILIISIIFTGVYVYYIKNIAVFDEELNFSEKMTDVLTKKVNIQAEQSVIDSLKNEKSETLLLSMEVAFVITLFVGTMIDVVLLSFFGIITCIFARIKMNYKQDA